MVCTKGPPYGHQYQIPNTEGEITLKNQDSVFCHVQMCDENGTVDVRSECEVLWHVLVQKRP